MTIVLGMRSRGKGADGSPAAAHFTPEIQGLRTVALVMVVVYHIWFNRVSGGVDVFLMVSAYLMTRSLVAKFGKREGFFNPLSFLVRRFSRLLPLAAVAVVLTFVVALIITPPWRFESLAESAFASLTYWLNQLLQDRAVDYYAVDTAVTDPYQHFWSLSIQGQVFVLWAFAHALAVVLGRVTKIRLSLWLLVGFGGVFVVSLAYSVWLTNEAQQIAYFDMPARLWEFAFGSLLALLPAIAIGPNVVRFLSYSGLALILTCGFVLPVGASFPGFAALWPLIGAAMIITAATAKRSAPTILAHPSLVTAGKYTYALYLTHWPILVFAQLLWREVHLSVMQGFVVMALTSVTSFVFVHVIERPLRRFDTLAPVRLWRPAVSLAGVGVVSVALIASTLLVNSERVDGDPGVEALASWATLDESCPRDTMLHSVCNQTVGFDSAPQTVTFIGNSHMQQYMAAFLPIIETRGWGARSHLLPGCHYRSEPGVGRESLCHELWQSAASGELDPSTEFVVILGSVSSPAGDEVPVGLNEWVLAVEAQGINVIAVRDNPRFAMNIFACGQQFGLEATECVVPLGDAWERDGVMPSASAVVDLTESICPDYVCTPAVNGQIAFLDSHHITANFAEQLAPEVLRQIELQLAQ